MLALLFGLWMMLWVVVLGWAHDTVFDREEFSKRTVELLDSSAVRTQLATQLSDTIVESGPSTLVSYRSVLVIVVESVVQTDAFKGIFRESVKAAHDAVFLQDGDSIVLNLIDSLSVITGTLAVTAPDIARQIPSDITTLAVEITEQARALQLGQVGEDIEDLVTESLVVALVAFAAAIALSTNRRRAVIGLGFGLVGVAALVLIGLQLGQILGTNAIADPGLRSAVRSSIGVVTADLRTQMVWLGVFGLLIAAVANAAAEPKYRIDLARVRGWFEHYVATTPTSRGWRVARGLGLVMVGLIVVTNAGFFVVAVAVLTGAAILYFGLTEVLVVVGRTPAGATASIDHEGAPGAEPATRLRWWRVAALTGALVVVLAIAAVFSTRSARTTAAAAGEIACNGFVELCDKRLDEVVFATSHNSMSAVREPDWLFGEHFGGIRAQLEYGIRGFLIDTHYGVASGIRIPGGGGQLIVTDAANEVERDKLTEPSSPDRTQQVDQRSREVPVGVSGATRDVYLCHNYCELGATRFADALTQYQQFLDVNPNEVLILFLEDYVTTADSETAFREAGLLDQVWTQDPGAPWPTLREMIDARRQVLVLSEHLRQPPAWYHAGFEMSEETPYAFTSIDEFSCLPNRGGTGRALFLMNHWLTSGSPDANAAARANGYDVLMGRIRQCEAERGRRVNMVGVNFYDRGDLLDVVDELNGVRD